VKAEQNGYTQVLWLDGVHRKYVEEVGTMNVMFMIDNTIVTAALEGTVLPGVTRDSILHILKDWGYEIEERQLSIDELMDAARTGRLKEAFGTGTAAVISPVGELCYKGETVTINNFKTGDLTQKLYDTLTGIQWGKLEDKYNWTRKVK
ncbi:MAG: aminotransferase class IV, partial [Coprobacillus sp.]